MSIKSYSKNYLGLHEEFENLHKVYNETVIKFYAGDISSKCCVERLSKLKDLMAGNLEVLIELVEICEDKEEE